MLFRSQGNASAQLNLGALYYAGQGVNKDLKEAAKWMRQSAQQGNGRAQFNLAMMYAQGEGVPMDFPRALVWFSAASTTLTGEQAKAADDNSKAIAGAMPRDQLQIAKDIAAKCLAGDYKACE